LGKSAWPRPPRPCGDRSARLLKPMAPPRKPPMRYTFPERRAALNDRTQRIT
jgi:hypothetical protein